MNSSHRPVCATLLALCLVAFVGCAAPRTDGTARRPGGAGMRSAEGQIDHKSFRHEDVTRDYYVHLPAGYAKGKSWPVLLILHGAGGGTDDMPYDPAFTQYGVIGVYPQGMDKRWNDGRPEIFEKAFGRMERAYDDVGYIGKLIDHMVAEYNVDPTRVYVAGMSNGGLMTLRLAKEMSHRIAAIGVATATLTPNLTEKKPEHPLPIILINGTEDRVTPYEGGDVLGDKGKLSSTKETIEYFLELNGCSGEPVVEAIPDRDKGDGTTSTMYTYCGDKESASVVLIEVKGGGHTWPGYRTGLYNLLVGRTAQDFSATEKVLAFCQGRSRPSAARFVKSPAAE